MLLIRALLLWSILSLHVIGGAALFRRLFPRESPWFGFIVPGLALVLVLNFIERQVAVPSLLWLLPFTTLGAIWLLADRRMIWKGFLLPMSIFLGSFAFTLAQRAVIPDIVNVPDGVVDLSLLANFCMGDKVPPVFSWLPVLHLSQYYLLGHYAMSVLTRLLGVDIGTGFNLSTALLSAFDCFLAAGAAWRLGRQRLWIALLAPLLLVCAGDGVLAYLWLTTHQLNPHLSISLLGGVGNPDDHNPLWKLLRPTLWSCRRELMVPGAWSWMGSFHSTAGGQFLSLFFTYSLVELLRRRPSNWPWICCGACPLLLIVTSTWGVPLLALYLVTAAYWVWHYRLFPQNLRFVLLGIGTVLVLLAPMLWEFLTTNAFPYADWTTGDRHTQLIEFLVLWWPVLLPWLTLLFFWRRLVPSVKTVLVVSPIALLIIEFYNVGSRADFTNKLWGYVYGIAWIVLIPVLLARRGWIFRGLGALVVISCLLSFLAWAQYTCDCLNPPDLLHLEGNGTFRLDSRRGGMLPILTQLKGKTIIPGRPSSMYAQAPLLAAFCGNRTYISWTFFSDCVEGATTYGLADRRGKEVDQLYDGKCPDPLLFLTQHDIAALVIYPQDNIAPAVVEALKKQLCPYYEYDDFNQDPNDPAGIFIFHPEMMKWPRDVVLPP